MIKDQDLKTKPKTNQSQKVIKPLKSSLKQITSPALLLLEKIKALDTTFRLADEILIDNN